MDEFEVEYDEEGGASIFVSRKVTPIDFAVIGLGLAHDVAQAVTTALGVTHVVVSGHANWQADRRLFAEQAGHEIEQIMGGEDT